MVALTFDDGPDAAWTPAVLDALEEAAAPATFFVVAEQIETPDGRALLLETLSRGHAIQMHCTRHLRHDSLDLAQLRAAADGIEAALAESGMPEPSLWRPPYGAVHPLHSCRVAAERGRQLIRWTCDPCDYRGTSAASMLQGIRDACLQEDSIVLLHDSRRYSSTPEGGARGTVELIAPLAELVRARGWELTSLSSPVPAVGSTPFLLPCDRSAPGTSGLPDSCGRGGGATGG